ncbi:MAG: CHAD domain-containing protein [Meiothermus sp.]|nr:CHAD domain-containing protein [Meiothermus sp.]
MRRIPLTPWLEHLRQHLPLARSGNDPEGVHQVRVAVRRLRVWLELGGYKTLEPDLAWLVRGAGGVRDLEVLLGSPDLPKAFRGWAEGRLEEARGQLVPMLDSGRLEGVLQALDNLPALEPQAATKRLERFARRVGRRKSGWEREGSLESLHALRRALRGLRYAREWLELDTGAVKELQECFGQVGDYSFILEHLDAFEADGGRVGAAYRRRLVGRLEDALQAARRVWAKTLGT